MVELDAMEMGAVICKISPKAGISRTPETIPVDTLASRPRGLPMTTTLSPSDGTFVLRLKKHKSVVGMFSWSLTISTAMSLAMMPSTVYFLPDEVLTVAR